MEQYTTSNILSRRLSGPDFAARQRSFGHDVKILRLYDGEELCSSIYADFTGQMVAVGNQAVSPVKTAFGSNKLPGWDDFRGIAASFPNGGRRVYPDKAEKTIEQ